MIVVSAKETKEPSGLSQLLLGNEAVDDSKFSKFLESFQLNSADIKTKFINPDMIVVDAKSSNTDVIDDKNIKTVLKDTTLLTLLQGEDSTKTQELQKSEIQFIHPKMINMLTSEDIKLVVKSAKTYLKKQIETVVREQNIDLKNLPQTLKGLTTMAEKLGVNLQEITLEDIALPKIQEKILKATGTKESIPLLDIKKQDRQLHISSLRTALVSKKSDDSGKKQEPLQKALHVSERGAFQQALHVSEVKKQETPIVKTTDESKIFTSDNNIKMMEKAEVKTDSLSSILQDDSSEKKSESSHTKTNILEAKVSQSSFVNVSSADSIDVKAKEAQQMLRHFSVDIKDAVENYKPPFTRLKMTLNPAKLGEVDVTLVQRGNSVHINVSSNNTALTILAHNVNELKTQLANNGVVNTSMQFSTSHGEQQQQEGRHQQFQVYKDLEQMSEDELETITSMQITLPRYV